MYFNKVLQVWTTYKDRRRRHVRAAWHCDFFRRQAEWRTEVSVSQEYSRVARRVVCCDTVSRLWSPPSPYLLRDVLFDERLQCEKVVVLRDMTKCESIILQEETEKWKYWLNKMYRKSESGNLQEEPEKWKY